MFQPTLMSGQRILVTGGGTGLGKSMSQRFLSLGADVAICGRRQSVVEETAAEWRKQFPGRRVDAFGTRIQTRVNGVVRLKLFKGDCAIVDRRPSTPHESLPAAPVKPLTYIGTAKQ